VELIVWFGLFWNVMVWYDMVDGSFAGGVTDSEVELTTLFFFSLFLFSYINFFILFYSIIKILIAKY
jgi:hypothetical protein